MLCILFNLVVTIVKMFHNNWNIFTMDFYGTLQTVHIRVIRD